ncbi:hypothetical protein CcaverHIS002_0310890 [Cutaneotrichosporon cavernicola]|uniref:Uncharacterized protein n=1 Tax=Cutaneotrichosporon cavernicola TaxID=279322 RepID=A0AA48QV36_9TREE|nr:uncharacterized protein CcaverHIS019_0310750 [Cutaneotrichosporon cavernicola]BEI83221.1 hypothetical protein CcaverHIS002_0310890 [Cutaneotrichosporon cavernicola]BEI91005.1 hypothetical protein CcaverHIS019_0310750 [Cutaneotrichosporon cavernicola]BEI98784.1 hypothetical protein CcaverHIS631_0310830 [Cutaneotrichosporon cavernicola]BEJ06555.1 hypothetical protein CcaverHIS641_0310770 [Cutaneotrichosporon cavernicola]
MADFDFDLTSAPVLLIIFLTVVLAASLVFSKSTKQPVAVPVAVPAKSTQSTPVAEPAVPVKAQASGAQPRPELVSRDSRGSGRGFQRTKKLD